MHLHDTSSVHAVRFAAVLDDFGLRDIVGRPIHRGGHQLDILATRLHRPSYIHKSRPAAHIRSLVDRYDIRRGLRQSKQDVSACRRRWRTFDYDGFITELQQSRLVLDPPEDVNQLVECYDTTLTTLLDRFAPARPVRLKARPSAPWYDAECRQYKAVTRKLETAY